MKQCLQTDSDSLLKSHSHGIFFSLNTMKKHMHITKVHGPKNTRYEHMLWLLTDAFRVQCSQCVHPKRCRSKEFMSPPLCCCFITFITNSILLYIWEWKCFALEKWNATALDDTFFLMVQVQQFWRSHQHIPVHIGIWACRCSSTLKLICEWTPILWVNISSHVSFHFWLLSEPSGLTAQLEAVLSVSALHNISEVPL